MTPDWAEPGAKTGRGSGEVAVLAAAPLRDVPQVVVDDHMAELARLADTAGARPATTIVQRIDAPDSATYLRSGKVAQMREAMRKHGATLAIFDEDLSPAQGANLEKALGNRVIDRTELILDIFALRARTWEAKRQVELAQLHYLRPRLRRMWAHLSREGGGIGARGPGEQQLETDRRLIDRRIAKLKRDLASVAASRQTRRRARRGRFNVVLVGYTNAGKSSILRRLSMTKTLVEDRLFATVDSTTRACDLGGPGMAFLTDTVGFIRKLPHHLVASFRATMEEVADADLLLHVIDGSHPRWEDQAETVVETLQATGAGDIPVICVATKSDRLTHREERDAALRARRFGRTVTASTVERGGLEGLKEALRDALRARMVFVRIRFPVSAGALIAEAHRAGEVLGRAFTQDDTELVARIPMPLAGKLAQEPGVVVETLEARPGEHAHEENREKRWEVTASLT